MSVDYAAKTMAILLHFGNHEGYTHSPKFLADSEYIQKRWHIYGGRVADREFTCKLKQYSNTLKDLDKAPEWAVRFMKDNYGINI